MRLGTISLVLALVCAAIAACGDGGGEETGAAPALDRTAYDPTPALDGVPGETSASDYDTPPSDYDVPPDQGETAGGDGGSTANLCARLCRETRANGCEYGSSSETVGTPSQAECEATCARGLTGAICVNEVVAVASCVLDGVEFRCEFVDGKDFGEFTHRDEIVAGCRSGVLELDRCYEEHGVPPVPPKPGDEGCRENNCEFCGDPCALCRCENPNMDSCSDACPNGTGGGPGVGTGGTGATGGTGGTGATGGTTGGGAGMTNAGGRVGRGGRSAGGRGN